MLQPVQFPNYPFTLKHLVKFRRELRKEGSFERLMVKKKALKVKDGAYFIALHNEDVELYRMKFLIGIYATLRPYYNTHTPFIFWSSMHLELVKAKMI